MKHVWAAVLGLVSGIMVAGMFNEPALAASTALVVASIFFTEATIIDKIEATHGKAQ